MTSRFERSQDGAPFRNLFKKENGNPLNPQAMSHVKKFLTGTNLDPDQVVEFGLRAREICQGKGQEVPEGRLSNLTGLFLCARELHREDPRRREEAMKGFHQIYDKLPARIREELNPGIDIIKKKVPIPPVDPKRVMGTLALPVETLSGHREPTTR